MKKRIFAGIAALAFFLVLDGSSTLHIWITQAVNMVLPDRRAAKENLQIQALVSKISELEKGAPSSIARVVLGGGFLFSDVLVIDKGGDDGIGPDDYAAAKGIILGRIENIGPHTATIVPFSRFKEKTVVRIGLQKDAVLLGEGIGGGEIKIEIPQGFAITAGESAWWGSGSSHLLGIIASVDIKEGRAINYAFIRNPFPQRSLTEVSIVRIPQ